MDGKRIRAFRKDMGFTVDGFAKRLGVSKMSVIRWEKNRSKPEEYSLLKLERLITEMENVKKPPRFNQNL